MRTFTLAVLALLARAAGAPVYGWDVSLLSAAKAAAAAGDAHFASLVGGLRAAAEAAARVPLPTVTAKTAPLPPGATAHSYVSWPTYYYNCSATPARAAGRCTFNGPCDAATGLPLARCDGFPNDAAIASMDFERWRNASNIITTLSLAAFFTDNPAYAARAGAAARVWFLDPATAATPDLVFAQFIDGCAPAACAARGIGIIDVGSVWQGVADGLALIEGSPGWPARDADALRAWQAAMLEWVLASSQGGNETAQTNNHGSWVDVFKLTLALHTGNASVAAAVAAAAPAARLDVQIAANGSLPLECARANSLGYVVYDGLALQLLARLAAAPAAGGVDLWAHATPAGATLANVTTFLEPYALGGAPWPFSMTQAWSWGSALPLFRHAAVQTADARFAADAAALPQELAGDVDSLLWPLPSELRAARA